MGESKVPRYVSRETIEPQRMVAPSPAMGQVGEEVQKTAIQQLGVLKNQALETNRYMASANISQKISELYNKADALNDPEQGLKQFNAGYQGFAEATIQNTPKENQAFVRNTLVHSSLTAATRLQAQAIKQRKTDAFITGMDAFDTNMQAMYYSNKTGDKAGGLSKYGLLKQQLRSMGQSGLLTGAAIEKMNNNLDSQFYTSHYVGEFLASKKYDQANGTTTHLDFMKQFPTSEAAKKLNDKQIFQIESQFKKYNDLEKQASDMDGAHYKSLKNNLVYQIQQTGQMPTSQQLDSLYEYKPKDYDLVLKELENAKSVHANVSQVKDSNLATMTGKIAELQQETRTAKTLDQQKIAAASVTILQNQQKEIINNPSDHIENNPSYKKMKANDLYKTQYTIPQLQVMGQKNLLGLSDGQIRVQSQALNLQDIQTVKSLPIDQGLQYLLDRKKDFPNTFGYYMQGLRKKKGTTNQTAQAGLDSSYFNLTKMEGNKAQQAYVPDAVKAFSIPASQYTNLLTQTLGVSAKDLNATMSTENPNIQSYIAARRANPNYDVNEVNNITRDVYRLGAYYLLNNKTSKPAHAITQAFEHLYGGRYASIERTYVIPNTMDVSNVKNMIRHIDTNIDKIAPVVPTALLPFSAARGQIKKSVFNQIAIKDLHTGFWTNDKNNDENFVRHNANGSLVYTPKGFDLFGQHFDRPNLFFTKKDLESGAIQQVVQKQIKIERVKRIEEIKDMMKAVGKLFYLPSNFF